MTVDLAVATPAFFDLTFVGLEALPRPGEERFAGDLVASPGGGAITAIGAARLGLQVVLAAPLGDDAEGDLVAGVLERDGIGLVARRGARTPTSVVLPVDGERSFVTYDPGVRATPADLAALEPRAVAASFDQPHVVPAGVPAYVTCGDNGARAFAGCPPADACGRALFVNEREAAMLTGAATSAAAAARLRDCAEVVVVTLGRHGALARAGGRTFEAAGIDVGPPVDTTGAGDLLCAAYVWADLRGAEPEDCLRWAVLYGSLSVTAPTGAGGAVSEARLLEEGRRRGLPALARTS